MVERYRDFQLWPPGTRKENKFWVVRGYIAPSKQIEGCSRDTDIEGARRYVDALLNGKGFSLPPKIQAMIARRMLFAVRARSKARGWETDLDSEAIDALFVRARGKCELTGLPFSVAYKVGRRKPYTPSIDRIDSTKGYTKENCRLVALSVNLALQEWGPEVLMTISRAMIEKKGVYRGRSSHHIDIIELPSKLNSA